MIFTPRVSWGARYGIGHPVPASQTGVVFHHDPMRHTTVDTTVSHEMDIMRIIEEHAATKITMANPRISYHWAVSATGRVYEGLGWGRVGAHAANANTANLGVFLMLNGNAHFGTPMLWKSVSEIVREGIAAGHLISKPRLFVHRDLVNTTCPGDTLTRHIRSFTLESLLKLSEKREVPKAPGASPSSPGEPSEWVYSPSMGWLLPVKVRSDSDWEFVREAEVRNLTSIKAGTPLSRMPRKP